MRNIVTILVIAILAMNLALAGEPVGTVTNSGDNSYMTLPVVHDTTMRTDADLTDLEKHFLSTVPAGGGLRAAVREMVLAGVVHVPASKCGNYTPGDSVHYWSIYQAWTGPAKVRVPLIAGPQGPAGTPGPQGPVGPMGPRGFQGPPGQTTVVPQPVIYNISYNLTPAIYPSAQMLGVYGASIYQYQLIGVATTSPTRISVSATGGASNVNVANANTNVNANNNAINIGDGSATGTASGEGESTATAGGG